MSFSKREEARARTETERVQRAQDRAADAEQRQPREARQQLAADAEPADAEQHRADTLAALARLAATLPPPSSRRRLTAGIQLVSLLGYGPRGSGPRTTRLRAKPRRSDAYASPTRVRRFDPAAGPPALSTVAELRALATPEQETTP